MFHSLYVPALVAFNILLYWRTLSYGLVIDDIDYYRMWRSQGFELSLNCLWHQLKLRLYGCGTFGLDVRKDHLTTLSLHIITAILISHISITAAFLWCTHPCTHQTSTWLTGRRYSLLNILFLILLITHTLWLLLPVVILIARRYYYSIRRRMQLSIPIGVYTPLSILRCVYYTALSLSGLRRYSFRYPYHNVSPYLPCTQPVAERYLAIPTILLCISLPSVAIVILPIYIFRTLQLQPMYRDIQSFYDYHRYLYPNLEKLVLIAKLYPEIKTTN